MRSVVSFTVSFLSDFVFFVFLFYFIFFFISGGIKAPAGHEEEEAGDVKDTD